MHGSRRWICHMAPSRCANHARQRAMERLVAQARAPDLRHALGPQPSGLGPSPSFHFFDHRAASLGVCDLHRLHRCSGGRRHAPAGRDATNCTSCCLVASSPQVPTSRQAAGVVCPGFQQTERAQQWHGLPRRTPPRMAVGAGNGRISSWSSSTQPSCSRIPQQPSAWRTSFTRAFGSPWRCERSRSLTV